MQPIIQSFKEDVFQSTWEHSKRLFKPTILVGILLFVISMGLMLLGFTSILGWDMDFIMQLQSGNPLENKELMQSKMENFSKNPGQMIGGFSLFFIIIMLLQAFSYALLLKVSGSIAEGESSSLSAGLSKVSFGIVLQIIIGFILLFVIYVGLIIAVGLLASIHGALLIIAIPLVILILLRLSIFVPAIVLGNKSAPAAFGFSWTNITWKRALYLVLGIVVLFIVLIIVSLTASAIAGYLGTVGIVLSLIFNMAMNVFMLAFTVAFFTAVYYRYTHVESDDSMIESIGTE